MLHSDIALEFLQHISFECNYILDDTKGISQEDFMENERLKRAIVRSLEIIGEAANHLPPEFQARHIEIDWKEMIGMRHKLIHHYFGVDYDIVWNTIHTNIEPLKEWLDFVIPKLLIQ